MRSIYLIFLINVLAQGQEIFDRGSFPLSFADAVLSANQKLQYQQSTHFKKFATEFGNISEENYNFLIKTLLSEGLVEITSQNALNVSEACFDQLVISSKALAEKQYWLLKSNTIFNKIF